MKELKILHISTEPSWRGGEQQLAYLLEEIRDKVNNIVLCAVNSKMEEFCNSKQITFFSAKKRSGFDLGFSKKIKTISVEYQPDAIHVHDAHAHTFAVLAASIYGNKVPIFISRRVDFPIKESWFSSYKYNHSSIHKILCVSDKIKEITERGIKDKSKLVTVYSGIDLEKFTVANGKLKKELGLSPDAFLVGNTSALADHKDYFTFIDAVELVLKEDRSIQFVVLGKGPLEEEIKRYAKEKGVMTNLKFLGFRTDISSILSDFDCFLITSKTEGLGTSILDAFACKIPVVATAAGGIPELVEDNRTGLLCPIKDAECLSEAILKIKNDKTLAKHLIEQAAEKVKLFSKAKTAENTLRWYKTISG